MNISLKVIGGEFVNNTAHNPAFNGDSIASC